MRYIGLTFMLSFGKFGGFYAKLDKEWFRICLGFVAFTIFFMDFEEYLKHTNAFTKSNNKL